MTKRVSIDEIVAKRRASATDDGKLYKAVILEDAEERAGYDSEKRQQRFVMSSETVDRYGDIVRQDGINTEDFDRNPVALAYHDHRSPIGWWRDVTKVNGRPKRTEGVLELHAAGTTEAVDEIDRLLAAKAIKACSIGFMPMEAEWILDEQGRNTWGLDFTVSALLECSVCSVPANPDALAKAAGGDMRLAAELFERFLDTYCEKTAGGIVVRKDFADAYMAMKAPRPTITIPSVEDDDKTSIKITLDLDEAERQAESFVAKWSKKFGDLFKVPSDLKHVQTDKSAVDDRVPITVSTKDGDPFPTLAGDWPQKSRMTEIWGDAAGIAKDGDIVTIRTMESVAEYQVVNERDGVFEIDLLRSYDPPPAFVTGSRQKAIVASARVKQSLRERGLLT